LPRNCGICKVASSVVPHSLPASPAWNTENDTRRNFSVSGGGMLQFSRTTWLSSYESHVFPCVGIFLVKIINIYLLRSNDLERMPTPTCPLL
jgi:hypothetical protein